MKMLIAVEMISCLKAEHGIYYAYTRIRVVYRVAPL